MQQSKLLCSSFRRNGKCILNEKCPNVHSTEKSNEQCQYFNNDNCFSNLCYYQHDINKKELYLHTMINTGQLRIMKSVEQKRFESNRRKKITEKEEEQDCIMSPAWRQLYLEIIEVLEPLLFTPLIHIISEYCTSPPMANFVHYVDINNILFIPRKKDKRFERQKKSVFKNRYKYLNNMFTICGFCNQKYDVSKLSIAIKRCTPPDLDSLLAHKLRVICDNCRPYDLMQLINHVENAEPKYEVKNNKIIPCNEPARLAFLCINKNWVIIRRSILFNFYISPNNLTVKITLLSW